MQIRYFRSLSSNNPEMNTMKLYHFVKRKKNNPKNYYFCSNLGSQDRCSLQTQQINSVKKSNQTW